MGASQGGCRAPCLQQDPHKPCLLLSVVGCRPPQNPHLPRVLLPAPVQGLRAGAGAQCGGASGAGGGWLTLMAAQQELP